MRKGLLKFSLGIAAMGAMSFAYAPKAGADVGGTITFTEPAEEVLMPYDETEGHKSFQILTRSGDDLGGDAIATHWSYWSKDCEHLADIFVCLTPQDTVVIDPSALQNEVQSGNENHKIGGIIDLTGTKGLVTVTAFEIASGSGCQVLDGDAVLENQIVGSWTIGNINTSSAFSHDAIGIFAPFDNFPDATVFGDGDTLFPGLKIQSFNPSDLEDSEVILLAIEASADSGNGLFVGSEVGPVTRSFELAGGDLARTCCNVAYVDNVESRISLPDFCFNCVGFAPIVSQLAEEGETAIVPPITTLDSPGFLHLTNCVTQQNDASEGGPELLGSVNSDQFLFGFHGMAVGPFGAVTTGKYTNIDLL